MLATQVLLVEDNPLDIMLLEESFAEAADWPTELRVIVDGQVAIDYLISALPRPDLAILDLNLPFRDGLEILAVIRTRVHLIDMPVIIFSSSPEDAIRAKAQRVHLTANCYITKPSDLDVYRSMAPRFQKCYQLAAANPSV